MKCEETFYGFFDDLIPLRYEMKQVAKKEYSQVS